MPRAQTNWKHAAVFLSAGGLSALALPASSGDWTSTYFSSEHSPHHSTAVGDFQGSQSFQGSLSRIAFSADRDYGAIVLGGSYSRGSSPHPFGLLGGADTEQVNLRAGYDFGRSLGYITLGQAQDQGANQTGQAETLGIGLRVSLNRALQLTGEFVHHSPSGSNSSEPQDTERLTIGAAFQF
jgi:outer membrane immunogenic protein